MTLKDAALKVLAGFDDGVFVRSVKDDAAAAWGLKLLPYLRALATLREFANAPASADPDERREDAKHGDGPGASAPAARQGDGDDVASLLSVLAPLAPQRCGRCVRGFSPGCPCNPTCHTREDNYLAALRTVRALLNALATEGGSAPEAIPHENVGAGAALTRCREALRELAVPIWRSVEQAHFNHEPNITISGWQACTHDDCRVAKRMYDAYLSSPEYAAVRAALSDGAPS